MTEEFRDDLCAHLADMGPGEWLTFERTDEGKWRVCTLTKDGYMTRGAEADTVEAAWFADEARANS